MSSHPLFWKNNRNPPITETITANGDPVDLSAASVRFKMRPVGSTTLKVDQPISNTAGADGVVRYDWGAGDLDTACQYLVWWEVTLGSRTQDMAEAIIEVRAHANDNVYLELEQL